MSLPSIPTSSSQLYPSSAPPPSATSLLFPPSSFSASASSSPQPLSSRIPIPKGLRRGQLVHSDDDCLVFREEERSLASKGHLTFLIQPALSSIYDFSPASVPLLSRLHSLARSLLEEQFGSASSSSSTGPASFPPASLSSQLQQKIGFVTSFKDPLNPGHPNLTLHAFLGPLDKASFYTRSFPLGPIGWYSLEDLIAEIRESSSNNRVKSGSSYTPHPSSSSSSTPRPRPLATVLDAGSRAGLANGVEITSSGTLLSPAHDQYDNPPSPSQLLRSPSQTARGENSLDGRNSTSSSTTGSRRTSGQSLLSEERSATREEKGKGREEKEDAQGEEVDLGVASTPMEGMMV